MRMRMLIEHVMVMMANIRCRAQSSDRAQEASIGVVRCDRQVNIVQCHAETYRRLSRRSEEAKIRSCRFASAAAGSAGRQDFQESPIQEALAPDAV